MCSTPVVTGYKFILLQCIYSAVVLCIQPSIFARESDICSGVPVPGAVTPFVRALGLHRENPSHFSQNCPTEFAELRSECLAFVVEALLSSHTPSHDHCCLQRILVQYTARALAHHCVALVHERGHHTKEVHRVRRTELHIVQRAVRIQLQLRSRVHKR